MGKGKTLILGLLCGCFMVGCSNTTKEKQLAATILQDSTLNKVDSMARSVIRRDSMPKRIFANLGQRHEYLH